MLYEEVIEIDERVVLADAYQVDDHPIIDGVSGEKLQVIRKPDLAVVRAELERLYAQGLRSLSVAFMHSYTFHDHEVAVGNLAMDVGFSHVSL
jgi:5-oxoprolinase (ATP-hydrolysing)